MGDLVGFDECVRTTDQLALWHFASCARFLNSSMPFDLNEHNAVRKSSRYHAWDFNEYKEFQARHSSHMRES
jgi:hypothetical protein